MGIIGLATRLRFVLEFVFNVLKWLDKRFQEEEEEDLGEQ